MKGTAETIGMPACFNRVIMVSHGISKLIEALYSVVIELSFLHAQKWTRGERGNLPRKFELGQRLCP
jgi:hypothetical protein